MDQVITLASRRIALPVEVTDLARRFASEMMDQERLLHLAAVMAILSWPARSIIVEIGAYHGLTSAFMAAVLRHFQQRVPILSIDPFDRAEPDHLNPRGSYREYIKTIQKHQVEELCLPLAAFSKDAAVAVPDRVALLVVDGSHHYATVRTDLQLYLPKVVAGGFAFLDDHRLPYLGVIRAVDEELTRRNDYDILVSRQFVVAQRKM